MYFERAERDDRERQRDTPSRSETQTAFSLKGNDSKQTIEKDKEKFVLTFENVSVGCPVKECGRCVHRPRIQLNDPNLNKMYWLIQTGRRRIRTGEDRRRQTEKTETQRAVTFSFVIAKSMT